MVPSVVTEPEVSPDASVGPLTFRVPFSVSVSLPKTVNEVAPASSAIVAVSATATGASLTSVTLTVRVPVAFKKSFEPLVVPSSVMV